jgi:uncharacterized protein
MQDVELLVDGIKLSAKLFRPNAGTNDSAVLLVHGWESAQDRMFGLATRLSNLGYTCLTIDLRGHGKSEGDHRKFSRKEFLQDVFAAYDFLASQSSVSKKAIYAIGSSFGGYLCALLPNERNVKGLVLRVPTDFIDDGYEVSVFEQKDGWERSKWKAESHRTDETAALRSIGAFTGDILVVESGHDEVVPHTTVQSYGAAAKQDKLSYVVMKNAPHSITRFPHLQQEFARIVIAWLNSIR